MSIISEKIDAKIQSLKINFQVNKDIKHEGVKGSSNESELSSLIKEVIPQRYKVTKGIIENAIGKQSNETDIFIYDDEILPPCIKNDLTFIPVEAVKYIFEVKSMLNAKELKTTISKFENFRSIGGCSPAVLFSFSSDIKGSELSRYKKYDKKFLTNPAITVFCASSKSYYYKETTEHFLKDILPSGEFLKLLTKTKGIDLNKVTDTFSELITNDEALNKMSRSQFALTIQASCQIANSTKSLNDKKLTINGIDYSGIKYKIHKWIGIESSDSNIELSFLSGVSNTLSKGCFGNYLLNGKDLDFKVFSICYEDMWGNLSCQDFDKNGLNYNPQALSFSFQSSNDSNQIIFKINK